MTATTPGGASPGDRLHAELFAAALVRVEAGVDPLALGVAHLHAGLALLRAEDPVLAATLAAAVSRTIHAAWDRRAPNSESGAK